MSRGKRTTPYKFTKSHDVSGKANYTLQIHQVTRCLEESELHLTNSRSHMMSRGKLTANATSAVKLLLQEFLTIHLCDMLCPSTVDEGHQVIGLRFSRC
ncbi:hypothetical protein PoB_003957100 [Plakobranchus ocellatus]|uniref:Uncharacterized protein n=1 Tax=Plakobranchus ocellatus TaxID=259542 RepID=A0AAV4B2J7_9GAST|nr:hypothetical protein PoB_003957100 [Plakobranchus ocellatus]